MVFNSIQFAIFLVVVFSLYWMARKNLKLQNILLLVSSFVFYGWWDYRFLFLLCFSISLDFFTGLKIYDAEKPAMKKFWLLTSLCINLGFLGLFKYYNFFASGFEHLLGAAGIHISAWTLNVILPVGISFYTFHGVSYILDIYNGKATPTRNFVNYSVFVSFFPLLVAGPIERATHLLPQVENPRKFDYGKAVDGMRQILWGLFKKIVIADNCASVVNLIYSPSGNFGGSTVLVGTFLFAFQVYCDFSGYSDIALGTARLFGFELLRNFAFPYYSQSITEFWRKWHISLYSWFTDYVFYPFLTKYRDWGNRAMVLGLILTFSLSGFWHGAGLKFIAFGLLQAAAILYEYFTKKTRKRIFSHLPATLGAAVSTLLTFIYFLICLVFFRATGLSMAFSHLRKMFSRTMFEAPKYLPRTPLFFILLLIIAEWLQREKQHGLQLEGMKSMPVRWAIYATIIFVIITFGLFHETEFIYFQF
ncbi:MAG: MBOAT family protein [Taibaiella sp.]|nr:MBOAT family protein [Taibaiella sp.]